MTTMDHFVEQLETLALVATMGARRDAIHPLYLYLSKANLPSLPSLASHHLLASPLLDPLLGLTLGLMLVFLLKNLVL